MVREDIVAGLKIAISKGEPIEKAKQSFISAGYPREEVEAAAGTISSGSALVMGKGTFPVAASQLKPITQQPPAPEVQEVPVQSLPQEVKEQLSSPNSFKKNFKIILLIVILLLLVGILILTIVFKDKIVSLLS